MEDESLEVRPDERPQTAIYSPFDQAINELLKQLKYFRVFAVLVGGLVIGVLTYVLIDGVSVLAHCYVDNSIVGIVSITSPIVGLTVIASALLVAVFRGNKGQDPEREALNTSSRMAAPLSHG